MVAQVVHEEMQFVEERVRGLRDTKSLLRDVLVFLAGAAAFHAFSHVWLGLSGMLPMEISFPSMTITPGLNLFAIVVNFLIAVGLLYGAKRLSG